MIFERVEYHMVHVHKTMDLDDDLAIEKFGSVKRLEEIISHNDGTTDSYGAEPSAQETDNFDDLVLEADIIDSREDWFSDRKGGYDISYTLMDDA
jgi:hypothetical protein